MLYNVILFEAPKVSLVVACCCQQTHAQALKECSSFWAVGQLTTILLEDDLAILALMCERVGEWAYFVRNLEASISFLSDLPSVENNPKISWTVSNSASWNYFSFDATWCDIATWYDLMEREWTWTNLNVLPPRLKPPRSRSTTLATAVPSPAPAMALRASSGAIRETPLAFRVSWVWA